MTIHPRPDQETQIQEAMKAGLISSPEEVLDAGLTHLRERLQARQPATQAKKESLVEFFRSSPLVGLELDLERDKDTGRDVEL